MHDKKTLAGGLGASFAVLMGIGVVVAMTGTAYALPLAGVGGFTIKADKITSESAVIYPGFDDTSERDEYPMAVVEQKNVRIEGLQIIKEIPTKNVPGLDGNARLVISADGTVRADQQMLKFSNLQAEQATFNQQVLDETNSDQPGDQFQIRQGESSDPQEGKTVNLSQDGPAQVLTNATIRGHYLASSQISIPGQSMEVQYDGDGDGKFNESSSGQAASG